MPEPCQIDREQCRMLVESVGFQAAAKETGINVWTLYKWAKRFKWPSRHERKVEAVQFVQKSPAAALTDTLARLGEETKHNLARAGAKASKHLAARKGAEVVRGSGDYKNIVGAAAQLHGWDTRFQGTQFSLNVLNVGTFGVEINES